MNINLRLVAVLLAFISFASNVLADDALVERETTQLPQLSHSRSFINSQISLGIEAGQLTSNTDSAIVTGPRVGFDYGLTDRLSLGADMSFAFSLNGEPGAFVYSGLNGLIHYTLLGETRLTSTAIRDANGNDIVTVTPNSKSRATVMLGLEQLFLNGTNSIYPAVGLLVGGSLTAPWMGREFQIDLRYTTLKANNNPLTMISAGLVMNMQL